MLVHKGGQVNNVQLITGVGSAEMSHLQNCSVKILKKSTAGNLQNKTFEKKLKKIKLLKNKMGVGGGG